MTADLADLQTLFNTLLVATQPFLPAAIAGLVALCALTALLRGGAGTLRRQMIDMDRGLRQDISTCVRDSLTTAFAHVQHGQAAQASQLEGFARQQRDTEERTQRTLMAFAAGQREEQERLRALVGAQLDSMREGNEAKLEAMRAAVDEKLQAALEKRVGESFARVAEQFAEVGKAIGEVRSIAAQVGDLKRLFGNVKTRGGWGEAQLEAMLRDALPAEAIVRNFRPREGGAEMVDFAVRLPVTEQPVWLPIDAKFPMEDYDRLLLAAEAGNREDEAAARRALEARIRLEGRRIAEKYVVPPTTVDFAVLYVPTDGLFAEIARTPGLIEQLRRDHRVMLLGPGLLPAFLHTIRVGHLTLVLERKAGEIGDTLRAVKAEWHRMGQALDTLSERAERLTRGIDETRVRARAVGRKLRGYDALDEVQADRLLGLDPALLDETSETVPREPAAT